MVKSKVFEKYKIIAVLICLAILISGTVLIFNIKSFYFYERHKKIALNYMESHYNEQFQILDIDKFADSWLPSFNNTHIEAYMSPLSNANDQIMLQFPIVKNDSNLIEKDDYRELVSTRYNSRICYEEMTYGELLLSETSHKNIRNIISEVLPDAHYTTLVRYGGEGEYIDHIINTEELLKNEKKLPLSLILEIVSFNKISKANIPLMADRCTQINNEIKNRLGNSYDYIGIRYYQVDPERRSDYYKTLIDGFKYDNFSQMKNTDKVTDYYLNIDMRHGMVDLIVESLYEENSEKYYNGDYYEQVNEYITNELFHRPVVVNVDYKFANTAIIIKNGNYIGRLEVELLEHQKKIVLEYSFSAGDIYVKAGKYIDSTSLKNAELIELDISELDL